MIDASHHLPKAPLAENVDNLISIGQVVAIDDGVVATVVVIAKVGQAVVLEIANVLLGLGVAGKVDFPKIDNLAPLVDVEAAHPNHLLGREWFLGPGASFQAVQLRGRLVEVASLGSNLADFLLGDEVVLVEAGVGTVRLRLRLPAAAASQVAQRCFAAEYLGHGTQDGARGGRFGR